MDNKYLEVVRSANVILPMKKKVILFSSFYLGIIKKYDNQFCVCCFAVSNTKTEQLLTYRMEIELSFGTAENRISMK